MWTIDLASVFCVVSVVLFLLYGILSVQVFIVPELSRSYCSINLHLLLQLSLSCGIKE